ncbi:hypothetical protein AVEN_82762-1 [Araneus ventricosus]|uniref:Uncharacterized protein n=1 Tax=Araneus ventricosus TaxID=182803 RepID=A0A4Y2EBF5_ARAVE|nr:hypothetical protein AVEN_82762-1 [Araneus ventricosus]
MVFGVDRNFQRNVGRSSDIKEFESVDVDISTVPTRFCRLCMRRGNSASGTIQTDNKSSTTQVHRRKTDHANRAFDGRASRWSETSV